MLEKSCKFVTINENPRLYMERPDRRGRVGDFHYI